jgi:hypothetical protein
MNRREQLIAKTLGPDADPMKAKMLDAVVRLTLGDLGKQYCQFWDLRGPGVMVFQPESEGNSMAYWTLEDLYAAQQECESANDEDTAESFRRILEAAQKINPLEGAGYIVKDSEGFRYCQIDYNKKAEE